MKTLALAALLALSTVPLGDPVGKTEDERGRKVTTLLMFEGRAEEAMTLYVSAFEDAAIERIARYGPGEPGAEGSVKHAVFSIAGQELMCIDSSADHDFTFTPAISLFVECESEAELDALFGKLSEGGRVFMPPGDYGFSRKFAWLSDRFGVSWQLDLPAE
jgi:predicted 3-demethylubiquinone-9 3-methyltransferase (glyoxalase superfamily)